MLILGIIFLNRFQPYHKFSNIPHFSPKSFPVWKIAAKDDVYIFFLLFLSLHIDGGLRL